MTTGTVAVCRSCRQGTLTVETTRRLGPVLVRVATALLALTVLTILVGIYLLLASGAGSGGGSAGLTRLEGIVTESPVLFFAVEIVLAAVLASLLALRKDVMRCDGCGATVDIASLTGSAG